MTIYDSIVNWANQQREISQNAEQNFRSEMKKLRPGYSADIVQSTELLNHVLETVKDKSCREKLSATGLHNLTLLAEALKSTAPLPPKSTIPFKDSILTRLKPSTKTEIERELLALKRQKLLNPSWVENVELNELEQLLAETLPALSPQDIKKIYETLVSHRHTIIAAILADEQSKALKPLVKYLYNNGLLSYEVARCREPAKMQIVEILKEEMTLQPRWTIRNVFSSKAELVITLRSQNKGSFEHGSDLHGAMMIGEAAASVCKPHGTKNEIASLTAIVADRLGTLKDFVTLPAAYIQPRRNLQREAQMLDDAFVKLEHYLPKQTSVGILDKVTGSMSAKRLEFVALLYKSNKSEKDLQKLQQLFYGILDSSRISPGKMRKVIECGEDQGDTSGTISSSRKRLQAYMQEKNISKAIDYLIEIYQPLNTLCDSAPYKDHPDVKNWQKSIGKILRAS